MRWWRVSFVILLSLMLLATGCKDISDRFRPASFGTTEEELAMVEALKDKYGDLTQSGDPRFLEARMTTNVDNYIPVDTATDFTQATPELYVWFVYDNFDEDEIEVEWIYLNDSYTIHTFTSQTGVDFGRATFILEEPDDGWPLGNYEVIIRGRGIQTSVSFRIIEGPTISTPLEMVDGKIALNPNPGWYFTGWEYVLSSVDVTVVDGGRIEGRLAGSTGPGGLLYDYYESSGGKNNFSQSLKRTNVEGKILHQGSCNTKWTDPAAFLVPGKTTSFEFNLSVESPWGMGNKSVSFDLAGIKPGYATSGRIYFATPNGVSFLSSNYSGLLQSTNVIPEGRPGDKRSIIMSLSNGYGFIYNYEWRE